MGNVMESNLQKEFDFYLKNQEEFVKKYKGKFLVIKDEKLLNVYDTMDDAYFKTKETHEIGTFLIQECTPGTDAYTETFHSRVSF